MLGWLGALSLVLLFQNYYCQIESSAEEEDGVDSKFSARNPKFFHIFHNGYYKSGILLTNTKCRTSRDEWGRCLTRKQCLSVDGGNPTDTRCLNNQGICCLIKLSWNNTETAGIITVKHNLTHIVQPRTLPSQAEFIIPRQKDVCQLRLDFKEFKLAQPVNNGTVAGSCVTDIMTINGAENFNRPLQLCGVINATEHIYLHYGASDSISINMDIRDTSSCHDILVTTIKCTSSERAPEGCTQYYKQQNANVRSFNYPYQQLNNHHYSICVAATRGSQSIMWTTCSGAVDDFFISGSDPGIRESICIGDRITIPGSVNGTFCGGMFQDVQTYAKPFALYVDFDNNEITDIVPGPIQPNGCPFPYQCVTLNVNGTYTEVSPVNGMCVGLGDCTIVDLAAAGIVHDRMNSGFCLRFIKT